MPKKSKTNPPAKVQEVDERGNLPSASSLDADCRCFGRRALCAMVPKRPSSAAATRGTRIHAVLEGSLPIEELNESDQITAHRIMGEEGRLVAKWNFEGTQVFREVRLWAVDENLQPIWSGRLDVFYLKGDEALLSDMKTGFSSTVPIEKNWQVKAQAVLLRIHHGVKRVYAALIHPHNPSSLSETIVYEENDLKQFEFEIAEYVKRMTPDAERTPNRISCEYCPAKHVCKERTVTLNEVMPMDGGIAIKPKYELATPDERGRRLGLLRLAIKMAEEEMDWYKETLKTDPNAVAGWKLRSTGKTRSVTDHAKALHNVEIQYGKDVAQAVAECSLKKLEDVLEKKKVTDPRATINMLLADVLAVKDKEPAFVEV